jgi:CRP/FNR family transcriptional regulator, cyclic AMP receptor protein
MSVENAKAFGALLRAGRWFGGLSPGLQRALLERGTVRTLATGERLFSRGDPPDGLYAVLEGAVRVSAVSTAGKEALLTLVEPPTWFGEIAVFDRQPRTHDAVANEASRVLHVGQRELDAHLALEPQGWQELGLLLAGKLRLAFIALEDAATVPVPARLARRLVQMAEGYGEWRDRQRRVLAVRQEELALMLSTSRQTVNQCLKEMEQAGWIRLAYGQVEIVDLEALREASPR